MIGKWLRAHPLAADSALAASLGLFAVLGGLVSPPEFRTDNPVWLTVIWSAVAVVPIAVRRRWLVPGLVATVAMCLVSQLHLMSGAESYSLMVLTYTMAAYWSLRRALLVAVPVWAGIMVFYVVLHHYGVVEQQAWFSSPELLFFSNSAVLTFTLLIGRLNKTRRLVESDLRERTRIAETTRQALADQAVADERRRIARELHDVVAHHVSVMGILATGARRSMATNPAAADAALSTIEETGRTTLRELRRLLNIMRTDDDGADLAPQPSLAGVESLIEQLREAGLPVRLEVLGEPYDLDPGVALTIYRIVQEALTNTLKHAGPATAEVRLTFGDEAVEVEATDDGRGPSVRPNVAGHGLVGVRERVALYGGQLRLGPRPGGGFRIAASIPMDRPGSVTERE
ncbi:two-component sensor histidine kinase [Longispora fulva]|nr:two-component sensor histidine kinase [Longispora fulva]